jgi:hypothetical protein
LTAEKLDRDPLLTLTHARLRVGQGDLRGARKVLRAMLARTPGHPQAGQLLKQLASRTGAPPGASRPNRVVEQQISVDPPETMPSHRIQRLEAWLSRLSRPTSH